LNSDKFIKVSRLSVQPDEGKEQLNSPSYNYDDQIIEIDEIIPVDIINSYSRRANSSARAPIQKTNRIRKRSSHLSSYKRETMKAEPVKKERVSALFLRW